MSDFLAALKRKDEALAKRDAEAKAKGTLIGRYIQHAYADSAAIYTIVAITKTKARIRVEDVGDAWVLPAWGRETLIPLAQARAFVAQRDGLAAIFSRTDGWWESQKIGAVVHYDNAFGEYVRGVIVEHEGQKQMRATALVGNWRSLWSRSADGTVHYSHHAQEVIDGKLMQPNASNMVEYPEHQLKDNPDPRKLSARSLDVPAMTPAERKLAEIAKLHQAVKKALEVESGAGELATRMRNALLEAKRLLRDLT
jgi:hypothetical protein